MFPTRFSLAEILVMAVTAGAGGMAPPTSTRISDRLKRVQRHVSPVTACRWHAASYFKANRRRSAQTRAHLAQPGDDIPSWFVRQVQDEARHARIEVILEALLRPAEGCI